MIGADPELFLHDGKKFISAIDKIGGTKYEPLRLLGGFALQEDNVAVEYNIPPVDTAEKFVWANELMLNEINERADKLNLKSVIQSSAEFDNVELSDARAQVFGCDPDYDAWELEPNPKPEAANKNLRSAGGHIHFSMNGLNNKEKVGLVRVADWLIGVPLAFLDKESERRVLYGRAGACRFKPYGVEYRTPSNVWLSSNDLMYTVANICINITSDKKRLIELIKAANIREEQIKKAINNLDEDAYLKIKDILREYWPTSILKQIKVAKKAVYDDDEAIQLIIEE